MYNDLNLKDLTFMVADPNQHIRAIVSGILHGFGAKKVHEVAAGDVAQREVSAREVDMLFCEMKFPVVNGFDVASAIRADINSPTRFIPIIFLTGHSRERDVLRARDCGGNMIITKPLSPNLIYDRLKWGRASRAYSSSRRPIPAPTDAFITKASQMAKVGATTTGTSRPPRARKPRPTSRRRPTIKQSARLSFIRRATGHRVG